MTLLPAGRDLDAEVATRVFGQIVTRAWPCRIDLPSGQYVPASSLQEGLLEETWLYTERDAVYRTDRKTALGWVQELVPRYSTDLTAAWQIVKHLQAQDWYYEVGATIVVGDGDYALFGWGNYNEYFDIWDKEAGASGPTVPLAICRAALKIAEGDTQNGY